MFSTSTIIALITNLTAASAAVFKPTPASQALNPRTPTDDGWACPSPGLPCANGCINVDEICCEDPRAPAAWSCPQDASCGSGPDYGCIMPDSSSSSTTTATATATTPQPPLTLTMTPTSIPHPGGEDFNPTYTVSVSGTAETASKTLATSDSSNGNDVVTPTTAPTSASRTRPSETCLFDPVAAKRASGTGMEMDACPRSLTSSSSTTAATEEVVSRSGAAARVGSWGIVVVIAVLAVGRLF